MMELWAPHARACREQPEIRHASGDPLKANETTVRNLLQGERQYVVPLYQRRYSWKRRDLAQLWADLMRVVDTGATPLTSSGRSC
jgi:hypothetical protein